MIGQSQVFLETTFCPIYRVVGIIGETDLFILSLGVCRT